MYKLCTASVLLAVFLAPCTRVFAASDAQQIAIDRDLQIPGETLKPGTYTFAVEDRMNDRAIVRISSANNDARHLLLLAVPSAQLPAKASKGIILFDSGDATKQILRGWACVGCSAALELVYPKLEAAKITSETGQSALAVDPEFDKLPANLSPDDMKVVTLWLLSPKRVEAGHHGLGLNAVKYASTVSRRHLPQTASNTYWFALLGVLSLALSLFARALRVTRSQ
jgi:LPXTG-motif cell wall-anchored protein